MMNAGKCPKCEKTITSVRIEAINIMEGFQKKYHGVSYCCSHCSTVISVEIDPIALQGDLVRDIKGR